MEISCLCNHLYRMSEPTAVNECAFSGSLCRIREFKTDDGLRYCLTIFSLADYKHSHFPHDEYNCLISKLNTLQSPYAMLPTARNSDTLSVKQIPFDLDLKIKFGIHNLTIGPVTAFGLVKTSPFTDDKKKFPCDSKWDVCTCKTCSVFTRLIDFEATAVEEIPQRRPKNVILFRE